MSRRARIWQPAREAKTALAYDGPDDEADNEGADPDAGTCLACDGSGEEWDGARCMCCGAEGAR